MEFWLILAGLVLGAVAALVFLIDLALERRHRRRLRKRLRGL